MLEKLFQLLLAIPDNDQAISGIPSRPPQKICLVPTQCGWQAVPWAEKVNGTSLAVILGKDSTVAALFELVCGSRLTQFQKRSPAIRTDPSTTAAESLRRGCAPYVEVSSVDISCR